MTTRYGSISQSDSPNVSDLCTNLIITKYKHLDITKIVNLHKQHFISNGISWTILHHT